MTALSTTIRAARSALRWTLAATAVLCAAAAAETSTHWLPEVKKLDVDPRSHALLEIVQRLDDQRGVTAVTLAPDGGHVGMITFDGRYWQLLVMDTVTLKVVQIREYPALDAKEALRFPPLALHWIDAAHFIVDWADRKSVVTGLQGERGRTIGTRVVRMMRKPDGTLDDWAIVNETGLFDRHSLHRVNVRTGEETTVPLGLDGEVLDTVFDHRGRLRAAFTRETRWLQPGAKVSVWYRRDESAPWQLVQQMPAFEYVENWHLVGVDDEADQLLMMSREGRDTWALFRYDAVARKRGELVIGDDAADLISVEDMEQDVPVRVVTSGLKRTIRWLDPQWERLQRAVDKALPGATNELVGDPHGLVRVFSHSDRNPGQWAMLDAQRMTLQPLGRRRLAIEPADQRPMQTLSYDAPDGLKIPAYLTLPAGPAVPRPMVVLIHGGPAARDWWDFDFDAQMFAAAGYAVFQPQFRGSTGFGKAFEFAGYHQWGRAMQDDVTAGVREMIARGVADPDRICVYGGSYGGYAAMWGLVKTPELYKCGITLAGVSDIGEMFTDWSDTNSDEDMRTIARLQIGDVGTMKAQFDEVSPTLHADRIVAPVLIGHGNDDKRVPVGHARRLESALADAHKPVDAHFYIDEGHGMHWLQDHEHFSMLAVTFVDRNIGPASPFKDRWVAVPARPAASAASAASAP